MFVNNGYPKKFVDKAVGKQAKSRMQVKPKVEDGEVRTVRNTVCARVKLRNQKIGKESGCEMCLCIENIEGVV